MNGFFSRVRRPIVHVSSSFSSQVQRHPDRSVPAFFFFNPPAPSDAETPAHLHTGSRHDAMSKRRVSSRVLSLAGPVDEWTNYRSPPRSSSRVSPAHGAPGTCFPYLLASKREEREREKNRPGPSVLSRSRARSNAPGNIYKKNDRQRFSNALYFFFTLPLHNLTLENGRV